MSLSAFQFPIPQLPNNIQYSDTQIAEYFNKILGYDLDASNKGVWRGYRNELAVTQSAIPGMSVKIDTGFAMVNGRGCWIDSAATLAISSNASGNPRIDRIVARYIDVNYPTPAELAVVTGTPGALPAPPGLTQTSGVKWEIPLAQVYVASGASQILNANITDEREWGNLPRNMGNGRILTIASGAITPNDRFHTIAAETGTTDDLDTISGLSTGDIIFLKAYTGHTITLKNGTGSFSIGSDIALTGEDVLGFIYNGVKIVDLVAGVTGLKYFGTAISSIADGTNLSDPKLTHTNDATDRSTTSSSFVDSGISISHTTYGGKVTLIFSCTKTVSAGEGEIQLLRGSTVLQLRRIAGIDAFAMIYVDTPAAGTYTYKIQYRAIAGTIIIYSTTYGPSTLLALGG